MIPMRSRVGRLAVGRRSRRLAGAVLVAVLLLATTGCLSGTVDVRVDDDGAAHVAVEVFPDGDVMAQIEDLDVESLMGADPAGSTDVEITRIDDDGRDGFRLTFDVPDAAALGTALESGLTIGGQQITLFTDFELTEFRSGNWRLDATLAPAGQLISTPSESTISAQVAALVEELRQPSSVGIKLRITLPGTIVSSNADRAAGGTASWQLDDPEASPTIAMATEPAPRFTTAQLVAIGGGLALVIGLVLTAFASVRKERTGGTRRSNATFQGPKPSGGTWGPPPGGPR